MNYSKYVKENSVTLTQKEVDELFNDRDKNKEVLAKSCLPMVLYMANSFNQTTPTEFNELFSAGLEGLVTAVNLYDKDKGIPFKSYSGICIRTAMIGAVKNDNLIKQPIDKEKVDKHMVLHVDNSEENLWEILPDTSTEYGVEWIDKIEIRERVRDLVSDKSANIFISYHGMGTDKMTTKELMDYYGCTRQAIGHHIHSTYKKLRNDKTFLQLISRFTNY